MKQLIDKIKKKSKELWLKFLTACKILVPFGDDGSVRLNLKNPASYVLMFITMVVVWLLEIAEALIVSVCEGFYNLIALYIRTLRKAKEDEEESKAMAIRKMMKNNLGKVMTIDPDGVKIKRMED
jgi:MFS superfamily sulfate permease-like transporter